MNGTEQVTGLSVWLKTFSAVSDNFDPNTEVDEAESITRLAQILVLINLKDSLIALNGLSDSDILLVDIRLRNLYNLANPF